MEQTLQIIETVILVVVLIFGGTLIWQWKSKDSMSCKVTQLGLATVLFALQIPRLIMEVSLNQSYGNTVFLLCLWALNVVVNAFIIGNKMGEQSTSLEVVIKITDDIIKRSEENSEEENDTQ